jgi:hypothetical protein
LLLYFVLVLSEELGEFGELGGWRVSHVYHFQPIFPAEKGYHWYIIR